MEVNYSQESATIGELAGRMLEILNVLNPDFVICDLNFSGSYRTVTNYVREWKSNHHQALPTAGYERLEHPPGEAQLDFGTMEVETKGYLKMLKP